MSTYSGSQNKESDAVMSAILALQTNTTDQNLSLCLEFIEQVAKVQGQLFGILTATAREGENGLCFPIQLRFFLSFCAF